MSPEEISYIIDKIPEYIKYVYPGYISIYIYYYLKGLTVKDSKVILLKSIAISYFYITFLNYIGEMNEFITNIILITIAVTIPYLNYLLVKIGIVSIIYELLSLNISTKKNEIEQIQREEGTWLCVYLKTYDIMYEGSLSSFELDTERERFLCLSGYRQYYIDKNNQYKRDCVYDYSSNNDEKVIIYYSNIDRIETR